MGSSLSAAFYQESFKNIIDQFFSKDNRIDTDTSIGGKIQDGQKKDL